MFESADHYKYILLVIDVFSTHIYTECLKDKTAKTVGRGLEKIFSEFESPISKFETDQVKLIKLIIKLMIKIISFFMYTYSINGSPKWITITNLITRIVITLTNFHCSINY
jgi:hypothetical protein